VRAPDSDGASGEGPWSDGLRVTVPDWLRALVEALPHVTGEQLSRFTPPETGGRHSAVLVLFGEGASGPDVLLIERAHTLRSHAGQPAFPGGALDPEDGDPAGDGPVTAALREAEEEVGLDASTVDVLGVLPALWLPPSGFVVHPVVAFWRCPHPVDVVDAAEVAAVARVPISELVDPASRLRVTHPSGWVGPAFEVRGLLVWGFTAGLLDRLLALGGWERPWDTRRRRALDAQTVRLALRTTAGPSTERTRPVAEG
jgi:8-oxo-dGTP pyrophosphatase MutT (NUDIX family)